jgi:hypothetical protein
MTFKITAEEKRLIRKRRQQTTAGEVIDADEAKEIHSMLQDAVNNLIQGGEDLKDLAMSGSFDEAFDKKTAKALGDQIKKYSKTIDGAIKGVEKLWQKIEDML